VELDIEKLKERASEIRANVEKIRYYASLEDQEFWVDERNMYSMKYLMLDFAVTPMPPTAPSQSLLRNNGFHSESEEMRGEP
jgi:hypothetical protein